MSEKALLARARESRAGTRGVREIKTFGGIGFMLTGNLLVAASSRGILVRVGKDAEAEAMSRAGARPMVLWGRTRGGYLRVVAIAI